MNGKIKCLTLVTAIIFLAISCISPIAMADKPEKTLPDNIYKYKENGNKLEIYFTDPNYGSAPIVIDNPKDKGVTSTAILQSSAILPNLYPEKNSMVGLPIFIDKFWQDIARVTVKNNGTLRAGPFTTAFWIDGVFAGYDNVLAGLPILGMRFSYSKITRVPAGVHTVRVVVDIFNFVAESNEKDNELVQPVKFL